MKKIRMILPALAILFAIGGTLVTFASPKTIDVIDVSFNTSPCNLEGTCTVEGTITCDSQTTETLFNKSQPSCPALGAVKGTLILE